MTEAQEFAQLQKLTPEDAVAYLRGRQKITPTYGWQDLWHEEHAHQFTISRLTRADLMTSMQAMITKSVQGDLSRRDFGRDAKKLLVDSGWWGEREVIEPSTGEILKTRFDPQRLKLIFDTNTRHAHAAGQWERIQRTKATHPYVRYITKRDERVRAAHRAWDGVTLPVDDAWLNTHTPPNGWHCRCRIVAVSQAEYDQGKTPNGTAMKKEAPETVMREWLNRRTDRIQRVPAGIDPGFGYNVGKVSMRAAELRALAQGKLSALSPKLAREVLKSGLGLPDFDQASALLFAKNAGTAGAKKQAALAMGTTSAKVSASAAAIGQDIRAKLVALDHDGVRHAMVQHGGADETLRGQLPVTPEDIARFDQLFNQSSLTLGDPATSKDGSALLKAVAELDGVEYLMAVKIRRHDLVLVTMYKRRTRD